MVDKDECGFLIGFIRFIILGSYLAEDLLALFWQDRDKFDDQDVFWIFFGFAASAGLLECCGSFNKWVLLCFMIMIEVTQAVLFMYICSFTELSILVFCIFIGFQLIFECVQCFLEGEDDRDETEMAVAVGGACGKCCGTLIGGIALLPYLYYNEDSLFRSEWFDIYVTISLWFGAATSGVTLDLQQKMQSGDLDEVPLYGKILGVVILIVTFGNMVCCPLYIYSIIYFIFYNYNYN